VTGDSIVTSIIKDNMKIDSLFCKSVKIDKELSHNVYIATAHLNNGKSIEINIESKDKMIYVNFDKWQLLDKDFLPTEGVLKRSPSGSGN
jgi:hypothetical protein